MKITEGSKACVDFWMLMIGDNALCRSADEFQDKAENVSAIGPTRIPLSSL